MTGCGLSLESTDNVVAVQNRSDLNLLDLEA
jgi:hypothetical protein